MKQYNAILDECTHLVMKAVSPEDKKKLTSSHVRSKVDQAIHRLFNDCKAEGTELARRCVEPGGRERVQVKVAVRAAMAEVEGEDIAFNYVRNYVPQLLDAVFGIPTRHNAKKIAEALEELFS